MARISRNPEFLALQRAQLDQRLRAIPPIETPNGGWVRTIRTALGMSAAQLGRRLGVSQQEAANLERREKNGTITIATLGRAAESLGCELRILLVPKTSLEETVRRQATEKASAERNRVMHTMRLEAQEAGVDRALSHRQSPEIWLAQRLPQLWD